MIDTDSYSARLRPRAVDLAGGKILLADFRGSGQEADLTDPPNCGGVGRIRHFRRATSAEWPANPLPIDPAASFLGLPDSDAVEAQVFQNAACNWRCWYCYVPFELLGAAKGTWVTPRDLIERYARVDGRPPIIDLTGGQPDLIPEWVPWMMRALCDADLQDSVYLWSDDNLSNDYFWQFLDSTTRKMMGDYRGYGRVCCFKGFDEMSFAFNTDAAPVLFNRQFELFAKLLATGLDLYAYATFTGPSSQGLPGAMRTFVDRLQDIAESLPLRLVPLEITEYGPVTPRLNPARRESMEVQRVAVEAWQAELERRFSARDRGIRIAKVPLGART